MGVAREAATLAAAGLVEELKAEGEEEGEDELDKRLGVVKELVLSRFIVEINGDRAVFACHFGGLAHVSSPCRWLSVQRRQGEGNPLQEQAYGERIGASPLNPMECACNQLDHWAAMIAHSSIPFCPCNSRQTGLLY